jgi:hypothetical protein
MCTDPVINNSGVCHPNHGSWYGACTQRTSIIAVKDEIRQVLEQFYAGLDRQINVDPEPMVKV